VTLHRILVHVIFETHRERRSRRRVRKRVVAGCSDLDLGTSGQFRPEVKIGGRTTRVLAEQAAAIVPARLGASLGNLTFDELRHVDAALRLVLDL
jgi:mRNA-degrading endonuclease toxin of MazEF toxin-antitoxin module